jgi:hypothetical protein
MRRAAVVTVGARRESLGALKLARWLRREGWAVDELTAVRPMFDAYDLYCFSAVFSWRLPHLVAMVRTAQRVYGGEVWIGGPAVSFHPANARYVREQTGVEPHIGLDDRFDQEPGAFPMVYFSRGCPAYTPACGTCPVPRLEGRAFRYYPRATPAALLLDNNLSALPADYQQHIIDRYAAEWQSPPKRVDANSGFEPHSFTEATLERWKSFPLACWRFGYDDLTERDQALEMMRLLRRHGITGDRVRVYTLIGNEPIEACHRRLTEVIAAGCHPWPQRRRPLDWRDGPLPCLHDWDEPTLIAFQRFYSIAGLWKQMPPEDFHYQGRFPLGRQALHEAERATGQNGQVTP